MTDSQPEGRDLRAEPSDVVRGIYEAIQHAMTWMPTLDYDWLFVMLKAHCDPALAQAREAALRERDAAVQRAEAAEAIVLKAREAGLRHERTFLIHCPWCSEAMDARPMSYQIPHLIACGDKREKRAREAGRREGLEQAAQECESRLASRPWLANALRDIARRSR